MKYIIVDHEIGSDLWNSKKDLFNHFFSDFYCFILRNQGEKDLLANGLHNVDEFLAFSADWYSGGKDNCYGLGFAFHKYFILDMMEGTIDKQPETSFIGYCYQNGKYFDFLNFLITFFAWWRNDEHCTCFDPYNYCDNAFVSGWATLVDTGKLFYFTSETVYWWQSFRVKYALDNIPGTFLNNPVFEDGKPLPKLRIAGYEFMGWHETNDSNSPIVEIATDDKTVYAFLKRKDIYDYWEKEEKTIKKVYDDTVKKVDPA